MSRPLRLEFAGALYHVTSRGDRRENIYESDQDRRVFLCLLGEVCDTYNWVCYAYCLMSNHYHLVIETLDANLSKGMRQLNGEHTRLFNRAHNRVGHVYQGRYAAIHVDKEAYLLELARYVVLNPVRAGMAGHARHWPWSSYRAMVGAATAPDWLHIDWLLAAFGTTKSAAIEAYIRFVQAGKDQPGPWVDLRNQVYLGGEQFVQHLQTLLDGDEELSEIPASQRRPRARELYEYEAMENNRNQAIIMAYKSGGYSQKQIGDYFGLHYSRVSRIITRAKGKT